MDIVLSSGDDWHDDGGTKYSCSAYYNTQVRCNKSGSKYAFGGFTANEACCSCGGGLVSSVSGEGGDPLPDEGDDIVNEWMGGVLFKHKKHLQSGFILYWNVDVPNKMATFGMLTPPGFQNSGKWMSLGFSPSGFMAGADSVTAWFDEDGNPVVKDLYLQNQSPAGLKDASRQGLTDVVLSTWQGRHTLIFTRPWAASNGGTPIRPTSEFVKVIYAFGKVSNKCPLGLCNHAASDRWTAVAGLAAPPGMTVYEVNKQQKDEPCQGPADLECSEGLSCFHEFSMTGDVFAPNSEEYGACVDKEALGDTTDSEFQEDESWKGQQLVFNNNGGFTNLTELQGGFILLWTVNKKSNDGELAAIVKAAQENEAAGGPNPICVCMQGFSNDCITAATNACTMDFANVPFCAPCMADRADPACTQGFVGYMTSNCEGELPPFPDTGRRLLGSVHEMEYNNPFNATPTEAGGRRLQEDNAMFKIDSVSVALISTMPNKQGWVGFGWSPTGKMKGSDVVIGWSQGKNTYIGDFHLEAQVGNINKPSEKQGIFNQRVLKKNGQTAVMFERPLMPKDSVQFFQGGMPVIYASGPIPDENDKEFIPYHRFRALTDIVFLADPEDIAEAGKVGENELCGEKVNQPAVPQPKIECKKGMMCGVFPDELFDSGYLEQINDFLASDPLQGGYTSNNDFTRGDEDIWSDVEGLRGMGTCMTLETMMSYQDFDITKLGETQTIDVSGYDYTRTLAFGFELYWSKVGEDRIKIGLVSSIGAGWLALGMGTSGNMIGGSAVLGYKTLEDYTGPVTVGEYYLKGKLPWEMIPLREEALDENSMETSGYTMTNMGHETAIEFERPLVPATGVAPIVPGEPTTLIFALGPMPTKGDDYFGYHKFRESAKVTFFE